jgi:hypothetical protein
MPTRIRCQVIEVPSQDDWLSRRGGGPRELLPWADPYIAALMRKLEGRNAAPQEFENSDPFESESFKSDPFRNDSFREDEEEIAAGSVFDDGWQEDAFMPRPLETPRFHSYPPVYGGFPLLEDE